MNYYLLKRKSKGFKTISLPSINPQYWESENNINLEFSAEAALSNQYSPIYIGNPTLINKAAFEIIQKYQVDQFFKYCILIEKTTEIQKTYFWFQPFKIDCLHEKTKRHPDQTIKHLVLDKNKIGHHKIFRPENTLEPYLIIDLEILEKLLCAGVYPIEWEQVECI